MNQITKKIFKYNLYPNKINTYIEPFTDGSNFFWNKNISKTEFINDINGKIDIFYHDLRNKNIFNKDSIYLQHEKNTTNYNQIINSNFYQRLNKTYIMDRPFQKLIKITDTPKTFYYCEIIQLTKQIFNILKNIQGEFLIITKNLNNIEIDNFNIIKDNYYFISNYKQEQQEYLF